jgi:hypothetical protein
VIAKILNHADTGVTAIHDRSGTRTVCRMLNNTCRPPLRLRKADSSKPWRIHLLAVSSVATGVFPLCKSA